MEFVPGPKFDSMGRPKGRSKSAERMDGNKLCYICKEWKPESSFGPQKLAYDGLETRCKKCNSKRTIARNKTRTFTLKECLRLLAHAHKRMMIFASDRRKAMVADSCICTEVLADLWKEQGGRCAVTGVEMTYVRHQGKVPTNVSIDRIDSTAGYTRDNVQLVCWAVNVMKHDFSTDELRWWCQKILEPETSP